MGYWVAPYFYMLCKGQRALAKTLTTHRISTGHLLRLKITIGFLPGHWVWLCTEKIFTFKNNLGILNLFMPILFLTFHFHEKKNDSTFRIVIVIL